MGLDDINVASNVDVSRMHREDQPQLAEIELGSTVPDKLVQFIQIKTR